MATTAVMARHRAMTNPVVHWCARPSSRPCAGRSPTTTIFEVVIESPGATTARLLALDPGDDPQVGLWLTPSPWPAIVADTLDREGRPAVLAEPGDPVAATGLVAVAPTDRLNVLLAACGGALTGSCLAQNAIARWVDLPGGTSAWGPVRPGLADPLTSTAGLVALQSVVASLVGRDDFARNDIETDAVLTAIEGLAAVESNLTSAGSPLQLLLTIGPGTYDVVIDLGAVARPAVQASSRRDSLTVQAESDLVVGVVAVTPIGGRSPIAAVDLAAALRAAGWDDAASGDSGGTLNPGVYVALQDAWQEADS